ncbi:MAG: NPCBM/NEW2 domain-containing protein, partial [Planctomycetota bacterium]
MWNEYEIKLVLVITIVIGYFGSACVIADDSAGAVYISDKADELIVYSTQKWGKLGINTAVNPGGDESVPKLRIRDRNYDRGLGHHANGEIFVDLAGRYKLFEAEVGIQWQGGNVGSVVFQVFVDGEKRFDSGLITGNDPPKNVRLSVEGASELR